LKSHYITFQLGCSDSNFTFVISGALQPTAT